ncbi:MAG: ABC transporter substrate-binding protein [Dehalococcoidia bacterium]|nr:ABC transporter substrate-binding protein [Dehalococcoidia bacterium]MCA9853999.1 ABC transporter substrate-binding protein [Dehalococcoidia bacterium]
MKVEENTRWSRWSGMSRRRFLQTGATAGVGAAGFALVGCGDDDDDDDENGGNTPSAGETPDQGQPKVGGRLQELNTSEPDQYDPHRDAGYPGLIVMSAVYNGLLRTRNPIGEDFVIEGDLAEDLPEQPDDTTYVYRLRDGIKWQNVDPTNGRAMTSEDIAKNFDRMQTDKPDYVLRPMFSMIDSIDTPDDVTIRVNLKEPYGQFAVNTADIWAKVIPPELYDGDQSKVHPVGSGPFIFESAQQGVGQTLNKNPEYFRNGQPYVDGIDFLIVSDQAVRAASFQSGELDTMIGAATPIMEQLKSDYSDGHYDLRVGVMNPFMINNSIAPFDNPLVRRAIYHAIDPELIINLQFQGLALKGQPLPAWLSRYNLAEDEIPAYDPAEAKRLLEAAGMPDGFKFVNRTFQGGTGAFGTLQVQQSLAEVGIEMENQEMEWADWRANVYGIKGDFEVTMGGEFDYISPDRQLYNAFYSEGSANNRHVDDPDLDKLLIDARRELDETAQVEKYKATAKYLVDNAVSVWLPQGQGYVATQPWVKGWFWQYSAGALFERNFMDEVWLDRE